VIVLRQTPGDPPGRFSQVTQITNEDALRLVAAQVVGIEDRIERVYLWFERLMAAVKGAFVLWASLLATLAPAFFGEKVGRIYWEYVDNLLMLGFARQMTEVRV
jgi:hypothetical protein